ncbi:uncharacterized protein SCHCODRAFT_02633448 [Schizophyllum commune H4-8]|nr:uncharacterized protein SCHCODRAFT_02633448 [Schizophyllum commune H4-8]KAI5889067.1 hypothetical protein SCHCODRAFT_02633448 [Schizophyllum commune H4-8]
MQILQDQPRVISLCERCDYALESRTGHPDLNTNARSSCTPASAAEHDALLASLSQVNQNIGDCDSAIERLRQKSEQISQQRRLLFSAAADITTLLSPLRRLPSEILAEIARFTLPRHWFEGRIGRYPWAFTQVCRSWRAAALDMRWVWSRIRLPLGYYSWPKGDGKALTEIVKTYLERSGQYPVALLDVNAPNMYDGLRLALQEHAWHIGTLEATFHDGKLPFDAPLPALKELIIRDGDICGLVAPNLVVVEICLVCNTIELPWANLRALMMSFMMDFSEISFLRPCLRLEVLSLLADEGVARDVLPLSQPLLFPLLHTLELGGASILFGPHIYAPALSHAVLNMMRRDWRGEGWYNKLCQSYEILLSGLLASVACITLRNRNGVTDDTDLLRRILCMPKTLRKVAFVEETLGIDRQRIPATKQACLEMLSYKADKPSFAELGEVEIVTARRVHWTDKDVACVRHLLESRSASAKAGCLPLKRFFVCMPNVLRWPAEFSDKSEGWAGVTNSEGRRILDIYSSDPEQWIGPFRAGDYLQ